MNPGKRAVFPSFVILLAAVSTMASRPSGRAVSASCVIDSDTTALAIAAVRQILTSSDSTSLVSVGIPYRPTTIELVTVSATCASVIAAFNELFAPDEAEKMVQEAVIIRADNAYVLRSRGSPVSYLFFDSLFTFRFSLTEVG